MSKQNLSPGLLGASPYTMVSEIMWLREAFKETQAENDKLKEDARRAGQTIQRLLAERAALRRNLDEIKLSKVEESSEKDDVSADGNTDTDLLDGQKAQSKVRKRKKQGKKETENTKQLLELQKALKDKDTDAQNAKKEVEILKKELSEVKKTLEEERKEKEEAQQEIGNVQQKLLEVQKVVEEEIKGKLVAEKESENLKKDLLQVKKVLEEEKRGMEHAKIEIKNVKQESENVKRELLAAQRELEEEKIDAVIKMEMRETELTEAACKKALKQLKEQKKEAKKNLEVKVKEAKKKLKQKVKEAEQQIQDNIKELKKNEQHKKTKKK